MRIDIDADTLKLLEAIRSENYIYGKGHTNTVRFLARYYNRHKGVEKLLEQELTKIPAIIREAFKAALRDGIANLFAAAE